MHVLRVSPDLPGSRMLIAHSPVRRDPLTLEQQRIVDASLDGPFIVNAGAGTGKTYTLVRRAVRLVEERILRPRELLVVTFTKKAANEIAERLAVEFERTGVHELPECGTFHSIAAGLLREFAYVTGDSPDLRAVDDPRARGVFRRAYGDLLAGTLGVDLGALPMLDREDVLVRELATLALDLKNRGIPVDRFEREALAATEYLRAIPFGQLFTWGPRNPRKDEKPKPARTEEERREEADREARNIAAVAALLRRFDTLLASDGVLTYGDLLTRAIAMLERFPAIAETLRRRWRHALVDELQDTNAQQLAFIRAIFGDDLRPVMAVGDVRQAIYEWNGADPQGIVKLAERPGTTVFPLTENRRSFQQILDAAHAMLPADGTGAGEPLRAKNGVARHASIRHAVLCEGGDTAACREAEAAAIAGEIAALLDSGERPGDLAILLRSRTSARTYATALAERGIASRTHGGVGFFDAPEIVDALAWCRLALDPNDRFALARVVESPAVAFSDGTAAALFAPPAVPAAVLAAPAPAWLDPAETERFERLRATLTHLAGNLGRPVADAVRAIVRETAVDAARIARSPASASQIAANVAKLIALAEGFAHDLPLARLADFIGEVDERAALEDDESEAELGGDEIAIMTIHAAKGLEWRHVFIANVSPQTFPNTSGRRAQVVERDPRSNALAFAYGTNGKKPLRWYLRDEHDPETGRRSDVKPGLAPEERRLFYVAITRAKHGVWISGVKPKNTQSSFMTELIDYLTTRDAYRPFPVAVRAAETVELQLPFDGSAEPARQPGLERLAARLVREPARAEPERGKLSYTAIATFATCPRLARLRYALRVPDFRDAPDVALPAPGEPGAGETREIDAATYGNIVHRALEMVALETIAGRAYQTAELVDAALAEADAAGDDALRSRTLAAVSHAIDALAGFTPVAAEEAFDTTIAGAAVGGFVDLVTRDARDLWIVDYKTGRLPDAAYATQLALYRRALRERYPDARLAILRIADDAATLVEPAVPDDAAIDRLVVEAAPMDRDEPRTGFHCASCPYAGALCPAGEAYLRAAGAR